MCKTKQIEIPAGERQTYGNRPCLWETNPELASQLVDPQDGWRFTAGSNKKALWTCGDHEWEATPDKRTSGKGCPYCSGRRATKETCLATVNPELAKQLVDQSLGEKLTSRSHKKVLWTCGRHEWSVSVANRAKGNGCPYCSGHRICKDNCLATVNPRLASELVDQSLANKLTASSNKKVLWQCGKGHQWEALVGHRSNGTNCPKCASSKMNTWSLELCESLGLDFAAEARFDECKSERQLPFDIAIFDGNRKAIVLIECQGRQHAQPVRWSKSITAKQAEINLANTQERDQIKRDFCEREGITLIEIDHHQKGFTNADHLPGEWFKYALADCLFEAGAISHEQLRSVSQGCSTFEPQEGVNLLAGVTRGRDTGQAATEPEMSPQDVQPGYPFDVAS